MVGGESLIGSFECLCGGGEGLIGKFGCLRGGHKESHSTQSQLHRHGVTDGMHRILTNLLFDVRA